MSLSEPNKKLLRTMIAAAKETGGKPRALAYLYDPKNKFHYGLRQGARSFEWKTWASLLVKPVFDQVFKLEGGSSKEILIVYVDLEAQRGRIKLAPRPANFSYYTQKDMISLLQDTLVPAVG